MVCGEISLLGQNLHAFFPALQIMRRNNGLNTKKVETKA
jgi:hypothetical protein